MTGHPLSIYIHWPFCAAKCPYCDFNSQVLPQNLDESVWEQAYLRELERYAALLPDCEIATIYFGGGTPSLMAPRTLAAILNKIAAHWPVQQFCEITLEANPASSETEKFKAFKKAGINRLSLGVQALNAADLRFLGRVHDENAAREALEITANTFDHFSFDLIYARKGQTPAAWAKELADALSFGAQHMSLYQLTIEEGTAFHKRALQHEALQADEASSVEMYEMTQELMASAGLPAYEISNYAAAGHASRHNLAYWHYDDYIGIGPGAHGRFVSREGLRRAMENVRRPSAWLAQIVEQNQETVSGEILDDATAQREALMMGLRLTDGIAAQHWAEKFGADSLLALAPVTKRQALCAEGLLDVSAPDALRLTAAGRQRLDAVLAYLLA